MLIAAVRKQKTCKGCGVVGKHPNDSTCTMLARNKTCTCCRLVGKHTNDCTVHAKEKEDRANKRKAKEGNKSAWESGSAPFAIWQYLNGAQAPASNLPGRGFAPASGARAPVQKSRRLARCAPMPPGYADVHAGARRPSAVARRPSARAVRVLNQAWFAPSAPPRP